MCPTRKINGQAKPVPYAQVLAHELCGHAISGNCDNDYVRALVENRYLVDEHKDKGWVTRPDDFDKKSGRKNILILKMIKCI